MRLRAAKKHTGTAMMTASSVHDLGRTVGDGNGTQIGAPADRQGSGGSFVLRPGQRAVSRVDETVAENYDAATCRPHAVDGFRIYVPNATRSQFVAHPTTGCLDPAVHLISHTAYRKRG